MRFNRQGRHDRRGSTGGHTGLAEFGTEVLPKWISKMPSISNASNGFNFPVRIGIRLGNAGCFWEWPWIALFFLAITLKGS
jgi:hypothetical protein